MNIAETIKDQYKNKVSIRSLVTVCNDFATERNDTKHGVTYFFIDDSLLTIKLSDIYPNGYSLVTQNKRA